MNELENLFSPNSPEGSVLIGLRGLSAWWTLSGGGAVVYHLRHRSLKELDFFFDLDQLNDAVIAQSVRLIVPPRMPDALQNSIQLQTLMANKQGVFKLNFSKITLSFIVKPKVRSFRDRTADPSHLAVASLEDALIGKLFATLERTYLNDYLDWVWAIDSGLRAQEALQAARAIEPFHYDRFDIVKAFRSLCDPPEAIRASLAPDDLDLLSGFYAQLAFS